MSAECQERNFRAYQEMANFSLSIERIYCKVYDVTYGSVAKFTMPQQSALNLPMKSKVSTT
ncbi:hypothetical protein XQ55_24600 [Salmonella enterica]|uniref:Uncharacterized protein n=1 Tax=Salmonella enterica subsp. enterica serovar Aqua TaxID=1302615 RepID=A0A5X6EJ92_SALET|nr:hypothetical protein [Salmonella enterica]EAW1210517.1 hypothetical protein [Salmonella enterica subsp. enterica]EBV5753095.1 hypothetical protein [Salmonella enterica subsp. enterica serovar Inverness]ECA3790653.1 hypothetical protein [Salmonella enterica subsp. enterica serovar Aqua]OHM22493.1 hypothetical protein A7T20_10295 [Salmonella enterica subsp. enterica serovar Muenchen]